MAASSLGTETSQCISTWDETISVLFYYCSKLLWCFYYTIFWRSLLRKAIEQNKVGARPLTKELTDKVKVSDTISTLRNAIGKGQTSTEIGQSNTSSQKSDQSKSPDPTEILTHGNDKSDDTSPHLDSVDIPKDFSKHSDSSGREETTTLLDRSKVYEIDSSWQNTS